MEARRITAVAALTMAIAAPAFAQAAPRSASTEHRLQKERMHYLARSNSASSHAYRPAYRYVDYPPEISDQEDGIIADSSGANPFGAPPYPWAYIEGPNVWLRGRVSR